MRAESTNNHTAGIDANHSTMFTLLLECNEICEQRWIQFELQYGPLQSFCIGWQNIHYHLANLLNRIKTKIFDIFRVIILKQQNSLSPIQSWSANFEETCSPIQPWSCHDWLQSWPSPDPCSSLGSCTSRFDFYVAKQTLCRLGLSCCVLWISTLA